MAHQHNVDEFRGYARTLKRALDGKATQVLSLERREGT
jgi:hypothetical protein